MRTLRARDAADRNHGHHPGYEAAVQALRTRSGEPTARFYALIVTLAGGWGPEARRWLRDLGHSGDRLPEWECGERCEAEAVTWAADTTARATMQMVNIAIDELPPDRETLSAPLC